MKTNSRRWQMFSLIVIGLVLMASSVVVAEDPIKIGVISPLTGPVSSYGQSARNGIVMGFDHVNADGGINGRMIEYIVLDDQGDPTESANSARRLIDRDGVSLIVGPIITPAVMAVAPIAQDASIPLITPTGTGDAITGIGDFIFRAAYKDSFQGQVMARFAFERLGYETVAIIYDIANDYSVGLKEAFESTFTGLGGQVVTTQSYATGDADFSAQLTSILMANPDALFIPDYYSTAGPIILQARQMGLEAELLGVDGWDSPELTSLAGGFEEGSFIVNHYSIEDESPSTQAFIDAYQAEFGVMPDALAALGYDAVLVVAAALRQAGTTEPEAVKEALGTVQGVEAATGTLNMDPEGTPVKAAVILEMVDGNWTLADKIEP